MRFSTSVEDEGGPGHLALPFCLSLSSSPDLRLDTSQMICFNPFLLSRAITAAPCERLIWRWPQTTALANYPERIQPTIKQHRRAVFNWIKIISRVITACWRMLNFAESFHVINANKTFFFLTLTSWQGASPPGRGDVWQGSLVILIFQVCKPPLIVMLCRIPPTSPFLVSHVCFRWCCAIKS